MIYDLRFTILKLVALALLSSFVLHPSSLCAQGSLTPPGAPAPTMRTLTQIQPRTPISTYPTTITSPGSYYLTGNLNPFASTAIIIQASDVTVDLNGFNILQGDTGIYVSNGVQNATIRNGSLRAQGTYGIFAPNVSGLTLEHLRVAGVTSGVGATVSSNAVVEDCIFENNAGDGLRTSEGARVFNITSVSNQGVGILTGHHSVIRNCVVANNTSYGIDAGYSCVISDCAARNNSANNINAGNDVAISHCTANGSKAGSGIVFTLIGTVTACTADGNNQYGIDAQQRGNISQCNAYGNGQSGIHANYVGSVQNCVCDVNGFCGILSDAGGFITIANNSCTENGISGTNSGAGIRVLNNGGCRIENNNLVANYIGVDSRSGRNIVLRNTAAGNTTNYNILSGSSYGPIINVTGANDISGISGSSHPAANLSY